MAVYTVRAGDTLSSIAKKLGYSNWQDLYNLNKGVIGSNPNIIRSGQSLTYGSTAKKAAKPTTSAGTSAGAQAGKATALTPFGEVLPWEQYFNPELVRSATEQLYANKFTPLVQTAAENLDADYANRGLTRSGTRNAALSRLYGDYREQQNVETNADILQQKQMNLEDYNRMQQLYESTEGKQKPAQSTYTPYKVAKPTTSAGTYGSSYLDWLNRVTRV